MKARNYCIGTWDVEHYRETGNKDRFLSFAFVALRDTPEEINVIADQLGLKPVPWMKRGQWACGHDITAREGLDVFKEIETFMKFLSLEGIDFFWSTDLIPEMPAELRGVTNTFEKLEECLLAAAELSASEV